MITANLYATFRLIAGEKTLTLPARPGLTLRQAVRELILRIPALKSHWVDSSGELYPHVHVFVNGSEYATLPAGEDTPLSPGDTLDFFPPVAGGQP